MAITPDQLSHPGLMDLLNADRIERKVDKAILKAIELEPASFRDDFVSIALGNRASYSASEIVRKKYASVGWDAEIREGDCHELYIELRLRAEKSRREVVDDVDDSDQKRKKYTGDIADVDAFLDAML